jgi:hypothetical protein
LGRMGGYGEGAGRAVRHTNPQIAADELRCLHLIGVNSLIQDQSERAADPAGVGEQFRRMYWGRLGGNGKQLPAGECPFEPARRGKNGAEEIVDEAKRVGARESWAQMGDEIGVAAKEHLATCARCGAEFRKYLQGEHVALEELGAGSWDEVRPYVIWREAGAEGGKRSKKDAPATAPTNAAEALHYYYTYRFMTYATAPRFASAAAAMGRAQVPMFSMLAPTPSWGGHSLDWNEFFDLKANSAIVFETSNTDAQVWQLESYLAEMARGISERHGGLPMGCLVKPHRGAPLQRMLSVVARGVTAIEWYTYGPDYAKGDSFSQRPELLEAVGRADRFLAQSEGYLYGARRAQAAEVALVFPRSSEIWEKSAGAVTSLEDAKWVYLALAHAHVPVDVLSEQQLGEGNLERYKCIYVVGPNLRRDAGEQLLRWTRGGGTLWTDAGGLGRDESNRPSAISRALFSGEGRDVECWDRVVPYHAIDLQAFDESRAPEAARMAIGGKSFVAAIGRQVTGGDGWEIGARFADGHAAVTTKAMGKGRVVAARFYAGLAYSSAVRRANFDMRADFDPALRDVIAMAALARGVSRPVVVDDALVEGLLLEKDGRRSVVLINWGYKKQGGTVALQPATSLKIQLPADVKTVRGIQSGRIPIENGFVVLPKLVEIELLVLE